MHISPDFRVVKMLGGKKVHVLIDDVVLEMGEWLRLAHSVTLRTYYSAL